MKSDTSKMNKLVEPFKPASKSEKIKSFPHKTFENEFKSLIVDLSLQEQPQSQYCSLVTEFISKWNLKEDEISKSFQTFKYPEHSLEPSLFQKLMVFKLQKMLEDKYLEPTDLKYCLDAVGDVLAMLDQFSSLPLKASGTSEEECVYYYLMTNFLFLIRDESCLNRIYTLRSYFELETKAKQNYLYIEDLSKTPIICDAASKLKQIFQNLIASKVGIDLYSQGAKFVPFSENSQIEKCHKNYQEVFKKLLELIPTSCLFFSRIYVTGLYSLNLYNNMIGLDHQLLEKNGEPEPVIKARCLLVLLSEVARIWQIKTLHGGSYFQPIIKDAIREEKESEEEDNEINDKKNSKIDNDEKKKANADKDDKKSYDKEKKIDDNESPIKIDEDNKIVDGADNDDANNKVGAGKDDKTSDDESKNADDNEENKTDHGEETEWKLSKTNEDIYFLERALYGGEINLRRIRVSQAEMILNEKNYCSLQLLNKLKENVASAVENVWNVKGLRIGRIDQNPHRKCGNHRKQKKMST